MWSVGVGRGPLEGLAARVVRSVPAAPAAGRADPVAGQLHAAVMAAHARAVGRPGAALAGLWARPAGRRSATFVMASAPGDLLAAGYPPGATTHGLDAAWVDDLLGSFPSWVRCAGSADHAIEAPEDDPLALLRGSFEDVVAHLAPPWAWLVVAEPLPASAVSEEAGRIAARLASLRPQDSSEKAQTRARRDRGRYAELDDARTAGLWNVSVLVGGGGDVHATAAVLTAASDARLLRYRLTPTGPPAGLAATWASRPAADPDAPASPFAASSALVSVLCRPPARELPGVRATARHTFDLTPEPLPPGVSVVLGDVLDEALRPAQPYRVPLATLNRHALIAGATGSGKSQTVRHLLEQLSRAEPPVPWLVIEPAKAEYAAMAGRLTDLPAGEVTVIRPGDPDVAPACLNPLEPEPGFPLRAHVDLVRALFTAAFQAVEPFPQVLSRALTVVYERAGWDLVTGEPHPPTKPKFRLDEPDQPATPAYPTLTQLQATAQQVVDQIGYGPEITANVAGFVDVRIASLREGTPGRFFEGGHPLDVAALLERNAVLEIENVTDDRDKAFLIGAVIIRIVEHLRVHHHNHHGGLRHLLVIEEAHRLLRHAVDGPAAQAVELFAGLLAEVRAYGQAILIAEQIPTKLIGDVVKNTALKVLHRLPAADDRTHIGASMNLTEDQSAYVVSLPPGRAAATIDGADRPLLVTMPLGELREDPTPAIGTAPWRAARSPLCPPDCTTTPCTLRQLRTAEHLTNDPHLTLWVELHTAALLTMHRLPRTAPGWSATLAAMPDRQVACAVALAVERSVQARRPAIDAWVDPQDLMVHAVAVLRQGPVTRGGAKRFAAGPFRWRDVRVALETPGPELSEDQLVAWRSRGVDTSTLRGEDPAAARLLAERLGHGDPVPVAVGDPRASGLQTALARLNPSGSAPLAALASAVIEPASSKSLLAQLELSLGRPRPGPGSSTPYEAVDHVVPS